LAHKKGKRWWIWLIPTLFLGPLMFLPLFLSRQKPQSEMKSEFLKNKDAFVEFNEGCERYNIRQYLNNL
jgi:hypothetical protein